MSFENKCGELYQGSFVRSLRLLMENLQNNESSMEQLRNQLSKVSLRKFTGKKLSDKCVHCETKVELEKLKEFVTCKGCEQLACHNKKCSDFIFELDVWECARCKKNRVIQQRAGEWLIKQLNEARNPNESIELTKEALLSHDKLADEHSLAAFVSQNQRDKVRQFIEELLAKILHGSLDDVSVGQLSESENCLPLIGPIPSNVTHQELKRFIQTICEEFVSLPTTLDFSGVHNRQEEPAAYFDPKRYEQLVATAVLNKMTDFYQNDKNSQHNSSGIHSDVELDSNHNQLNGKTVIDLMVKRGEVGQFSSPTIERLNSKAADDETHLLDYVQNHLVPLPDLSASDSANDDADVHSENSSNDAEATWEDNWLFKKRKLKTENQSIAMLVPSPTEEIKALIGDKNADETSDLSENSESENEDDEKETYTSTLNIEAKKFKDSFSVINNSLNDCSNNIAMVSLDIADDQTITVEAKNEILLSDKNEPITTQLIKKIDFVLSGPVTVHDKLPSELSIDGRDQTEEEKEFDSMVSPTQVKDQEKSIDDQFEKLLLDSDVPETTSEIIESHSPLSLDIPKSTTASHTSKAAQLYNVPDKRPSIQDPEKVLMDNLVPGSFAEREHIKWLHAAPIANNPYSSEALQRRLSETDQKHKNLDISNNSKMVDILVEESNTNENETDDKEEVFCAKKIDMKKYKRDYYINDSMDNEKRRSYSSSSSKVPNFEHEEEHYDNNVRETSNEKKYRARIHISGHTEATNQQAESDQNSRNIILSELKPIDDSLTFSEDSDTTRIYNLNSRETKIVAATNESSSESSVKQAQQYFRSVSKQQAKIRKMDDEVTTVVRTSNRSLINGDRQEHIVQETYEEKQVIEPEVIDNLPSVKKLAEKYGRDSLSTEIQLVKPKAFVTTAEDNSVSTAQHTKLSKASSESFVPNYDINYHPAMPIASITARSIPSQIRADLKKSYSYDDEAIIRQGDRPGSPEIQEGVARNSIAFFEQLKQN